MTSENNPNKTPIEPVKTESKYPQKGSLTLKPRGANTLSPAAPGAWALSPSAPRAPHPRDTSHSAVAPSSRQRRIFEKSSPKPTKIPRNQP